MLAGRAGGPRGILARRDVVTRIGAGMGLREEKKAELRGRLLVAARKVFDRDGYRDARIADIAAEAGVGIGTFYRHFESKLVVFNDLYSDMIDKVYGQDLLRGALIDEFESATDPVAWMEQALRSIFERYRQDSRLFGNMEELAGTDNNCRRVYVELRERAVVTLAEFIKTAQARGVADPEVNAYAAAHGFLAMLSDRCHLWFTLMLPYDADVDPRNMARLWAGAMGMSLSWK